MNQMGDDRGGGGEARANGAFSPEMCTRVNGVRRREASVGDSYALENRGKEPGDMMKNRTSLQARYGKRWVVMTLKSDGLHIHHTPEEQLPSQFASCKFWEKRPLSLPEFIPYLHVLSARINGHASQNDSEACCHVPGGDDEARGFIPEASFVLASMRPKNRGKTLRVQKVELHVADGIFLESWVNDLTKRTYAGIENRRFLVLVNPFGGAGRGAQVYQDKCKPIIQASCCTADVIYTQRRGHGFDLARNAAKDLDKTYHAIICVSGDGLVHEVINGLASNEEGDLVHAAEQLRRIPVAIVPAGSGNAMSCCLLGPSRGGDAYWATLQAIKGKPLSTDLTSITVLDENQPNSSQKRYFSFLSQAYGLIADCDLGTEHLRWMGDNRFVLGMISGIAGKRYYGGKLEILVADKGDNVPAMRALVSAKRNGETENSNGSANDLQPTIAVSAPADTSARWQIFEGPFSMFYAGLGPYMAKDFINFPLCLANDGMIDITLAMPSGIKDGLDMLSKAAEGKHIDGPVVQYFKASAYRLRPSMHLIQPRSKWSILRRPKDGSHDYLDIDGESVPLTAIQVEVHQGVGRFLSLADEYVVEQTV